MGVKIVINIRGWIDSFKIRNFICLCDVIRNYNDCEYIYIIYITYIIFQIQIHLLDWLTSMESNPLEGKLHNIVHNIAHVVVKLRTYFFDDFAISIWDLRNFEIIRLFAREIRKVSKTLSYHVVYCPRCLNCKQYGSKISTFPFEVEIQKFWKEEKLLNRDINAGYQKLRI